MVVVVEEGGDGVGIFATVGWMVGGWSVGSFAGRSSLGAPIGDTSHFSSGFDVVREVALGCAWALTLGGFFRVSIYLRDCGQCYFD
jgi:hypothetical protein